MIDHEYKEVYFSEYCKTCKYKGVKDVEEPCNSCLDEPINLFSHKPVKYEKNISSRKKQSL